MNRVKWIFNASAELLYRWHNFKWKPN